MRAIYALFALTTAILLIAPGQPASAEKQDWYARAVKKIEATFEPAEAKPGQSVTFKLTVHLNDGYHTYPTKQVDKAAEAMVNKIEFPDSGMVTFAGEVIDPKDYKAKSEPLLGIKELRTLEGKIVYERKGTVSASAKSGTTTVKLTGFTLNVCDESTCFPAKKLTPEATLKVLDGPPAPEK